jgi:hypothetical protein
VKTLPQTAFASGPDRQEQTVMEDPEEDALNEVDRIAVAVDYLRDLLFAATAAELRAQSKQRSPRPSPDHPPEP